MSYDMQKDFYDFVESKKKIEKPYEEKVIKDFDEFQKIFMERYNNNSMLWRGQRDSNWKLESTIAREHGEEEFSESWLKSHLNTFKNSLIGHEIGIAMEKMDNHNLDKDNKMEEFTYWALGQHHFLKTPLLDWSSSAFISLYFAYSESTTSEHVALYRLDYQRLNEWLENKGNNEVKIVKLMSHYNKRLINQKGQFTYGPTTGKSLEDWITKQDIDKNILTKYLIPSKERSKILRYLNQFNINAKILFPDVEGAARYSNIAHEIDSYEN